MVYDKGTGCWRSANSSLVGKYPPGAMGISPLVAYHATARRHRESISRHGLIAGAPLYQPDRWGVYVYSEDLTHPIYSRSQFAVWWGADTQGPYGSDLWKVSYIGPMSHDRYVMNGMVLHQSVPPEHLTLITSDD